MSQLEGLEILAAGYKRELDELHDLLARIREILGAGYSEKTVDAALRVVRRGDRDRRRSGNN